MHDKKYYRKYFLDLRHALSYKQHNLASCQTITLLIKTISDICINNKNLYELKQINIALYSHIRQELDILPIAKHKFDNFDKSIKFALPVIIEKAQPLNFFEFSYGTPLAHNQFYPNILEPVPHNNPIIPDIIIVPMTAYDNAGHRLGYGGGYYDRTIAKIRNVVPHLVTIGICYDAYKIDQIPHAEHDIHMEYIVTEMGIKGF